MGGLKTLHEGKALGVGHTHITGALTHIAHYRVVMLNWLAAVCVSVWSDHNYALTCSGRIDWQSGT